MSNKRLALKMGFSVAGGAVMGLFFSLLSANPFEQVVVTLLGWIAMRLLVSEI